MSDSGPIKPIPTKYKGIEFRSKLEANVARLFDACQMPWAYEQEAFDLGGVWYLPDFWLPEAKQIVEVKGIADDPSVDKCIRLAGALSSGARVEEDDFLRVVVLSAPFVRLHLGVTNEIFGVGYWGDAYAANAPLMQCFACDVRFFMNEEQRWLCSACGEYQQDWRQKPVLVRVEHRRGVTKYELFKSVGR